MQHVNRSAFVQSRLPWLIAAGALLAYVVTLNHWVSLTSLPVVTVATGADTVLPIDRPLHYLVTLPFRLLPTGWQPVALNALAAVFAAASLGLLARSVSLLPHDRTRNQRQREPSEFSLLSIPAAWAPPVFAALLCGFQLSFWEHATTATAEMLDLMLFAYVIRCVLEFRLQHDVQWLYRLAFVYGLAVANNYVMIGFFPAFVAALIWIMGRDFLRFPFVARMVGLGLAGLSLYLFLPVLNAFSDNSDLGFWSALRFHLVGQRNALLYFPRYLVLIAALTSMLPVLIIGIRWPSSFGDTSVVGSFLTNFMFHVVHAMFLLAGLWVVFDAPFSPREMVARVMERLDEPTAGVPFLTLYYLGALAMGYFIGYFLLVFGRSSSRAWQKASGLTLLLRRLVFGLTWIAILAAPAALFIRNLPAIRSNNGDLLLGYARLASETLPAAGSVVMSDQPHLLALLTAYQIRTGTKSPPLFVDTRMLRYPSYHETLRQRAPSVWPELPPLPPVTTHLTSLFLLQEIAELASRRVMQYLNPSFGYYFERVYLRPTGLTYGVSVYGTNDIAPPALTGPDIQVNEEFWKRAAPQLDKVRQVREAGALDARALSRWYSRAANYWGVELQRAGRLGDAAAYFGLALQLNSENISAAVNRVFNQNLEAGRTDSVEIGKAVEDKFGRRYRSWNGVLAANGPIDEPGFCYQLGQTLAQQGLFRQSAIQFMRVLQFQPANLDARLWLANALLLGHAEDQVLLTVAEIRARHNASSLNAMNQIELIRLEAMAYFGMNQTDQAEKVLTNARNQFPGNPVLLDSLAQIYLLSNRYTNALAALNEQLAVTPNNLRALLNKGAALIQLKAFEEAIPPLDQILKADPENSAARMNRAVAHLQQGRLDEAKQDYDHLLRLLPNEPRVHFGLGEIAYRRKDTPAAIKHYEAYLQIAPEVTDEVTHVTERLQELKSGGR